MGCRFISEYKKDNTQKLKNELGYDAIGFASGNYFGKFYQIVLNFASVNLAQNKKVLYICTYGGNAKGHTNEKDMAVAVDFYKGTMKSRFRR